MQWTIQNFEWRAVPVLRVQRRPRCSFLSRQRVAGYVVVIVHTLAVRPLFPFRGQYCCDHCSDPSMSFRKRRNQQEESPSAEQPDFMESVEQQPRSEQDLTRGSGCAVLCLRGRKPDGSSCHLHAGKRRSSAAATPPAAAGADSDADNNAGAAAAAAAAGGGGGDAAPPPRDRQPRVQFSQEEEAVMTETVSSYWACCEPSSALVCLHLHQLLTETLGALTRHPHSPPTDSLAAHNLPCRCCCWLVCYCPPAHPQRSNAWRRKGRQHETGQQPWTCRPRCVVGEGWCMQLW